jgi:outer membrane protein OmpA-like peptidoglycan-associated protein
VKPLAAKPAVPAPIAAAPPAKRARLEQGARETARKGVAAPGLRGPKPAAPRPAGPLHADLVPLGAAGSLPTPLRLDFERRLGIPLDGVRLHHGAAAAERAGEAGADALAIGDDLLFGAGRYRPDTPDGHDLLLHELAHVAQSRTGEAEGVALRDGPPRHGIGSTPPEGNFQRGEGAGPEEAHVLFDHDKADLDGGDMATLRRLGGEHKEAVTLDVYGYSSAEGDVDYNANLSAHRAMRVKAALEELLPPGSIVFAHAHGEIASFGRSPENRRAGISVRPEQPEMGPGMHLGPWARHRGLLGGRLELKLDPNLFGGPLGTGSGQTLFGGGQPGPTQSLDPKPYKLPGIGGTPPLSDPLADSILQTPLQPPFLRPLQRPAGIRAEDFDLGPIGLSAAERGLQLDPRLAESLQNDFIKQTDELVKLGISPGIAGWWVQKTLEKSAEYRLKLENPNYYDMLEKQDQIMGTKPKTLTIDLYDVPDYYRWTRKQIRKLRKE